MAAAGQRTKRKAGDLRHGVLGSAGA